MIESKYWRQELRRDLARLEKTRTYGRWSERQMVLYERAIILAGAQLRVLLDQARVDPKLAKARLSCASYLKTGSQPTTRLSRAEVWEIFDMKNAQDDSLSAREISNQLLHHYLIAAVSEKPRAFSHLWVFSDMKRNDRLYEISIPALLTFFARFANEGAARTSGRWVWNEKRMDYDVVDPSGEEGKKSE